MRSKHAGRLSQPPKETIKVPQAKVGPRRRRSRAESLPEHQEGNDLFRAEQYEDAAERYTSAIEQEPDRADLYSNRCACYLALERPLEALADAEAALQRDRKCVKALYRRAVALRHLGDMRRARHAIRRAIIYGATNPEIRAEQETIDAMIREGCPLTDSRKLLRAAKRPLDATDGSDEEEERRPAKRARKGGKAEAPVETMTLAQVLAGLGQGERLL